MQTLPYTSKQTFQRLITQSGWQHHPVACEAIQMKDDGQTRRDSRSNPYKSPLSSRRGKYVAFRSVHPHASCCQARPSFQPSLASPIISYAIVKSNPRSLYAAYCSKAIWLQDFMTFITSKRTSNLFESTLSTS